MTRKRCTTGGSGNRLNNGAIAREARSESRLSSPVSPPQGRIVRRSLPDDAVVLFARDLAARLRLTRTSFYRVLQSGALSFAELPRLDRKRRWSRALIDQWLATNRRPFLRRVG